MNNIVATDFNPLNDFHTQNKVPSERFILLRVKCTEPTALTFAKLFLNWIKIQPYNMDRADGSFSISLKSNHLQILKHFSKIL
ncbi:hypothetical protein [Flavobacterium sp. UBA4854]|uniref:hypothetical protein n=1 Tax=Flavobacterium sp. UBA4854 TaxID=1946548 RepID=UPI0025800CC8|nr:hypothetical protein [Flavobacterium sp. UBA4854]